MKISVITPSFLGNYPGAASRRDEKIVRAVDSVIAQTFHDWELWVVADGCDQTMEIMQRYNDPRVHSIKISKSKIWSGTPRNTGIDNATGEYIVYLDIDDYYGDNHLATIYDNLRVTVHKLNTEIAALRNLSNEDITLAERYDLIARIDTLYKLLDEARLLPDTEHRFFDWVFYNDYIYKGEWIERNCDVRKLGQNGTSNVCHRKSLGARWSHTGYAHDHHFTQGLIMKSLKYVKITTPEYFVLHMPGIYDL